jgi:hypothetical protein
LLLCGCASIAISAAPAKQPSPAQSERSKQANELFWQTLHAGAYDDIGKVKEALQGVYLEDPRDAVTAAHLGFLHIWRAAERERLAEPRPSITDDLLLSQYYFADAVAMTHDPRYVGFLASMELANGNVHKDEKLTRTGFFRMQDAVAQFPEFNLFTRGYVMGGFPHDSERFKQAVEDMWKNVDFCFDQPIDRANPDYTPFLKLETTEGPKRVCWNGWIAPHNHEGFALNFGDMLVKQGDVKAARRMYENAKLSKTYAKWPYREELERRIAEADANVEYFRMPSDKQPKGHRMMFNSQMNCTGCHADAP